VNIEGLKETKLTVSLEASHQVLINVWVRFLASEPYLSDRMLYHAFIGLFVDLGRPKTAQPESVSCKHFTTQAEKNIRVKDFS